MFTKHSPALIFLLTLALAGCGQATDTPVVAEQAADNASEHAGIQWYDGTIDDAFALAKDENKPLFFYWGAVWCPPCEQIKETVFKHPAFLAKSSLFVPVYMDGDTERAQSWGEHFAVSGYPTMIVFTPTGDEITRIPGWIDSNQYLNVLQQALDDPTSTEVLLHQALANPGSISADAYTRLAFYSWDQANFSGDFTLDADMFRNLAAAAKQAGNQVAWSRLSFHALYAAAVAHDDAGTEMATADQQMARQDLTAIFADPDLVLANSDYLLLYFEDFVPLLAAEGAERDLLGAQWEATMATIRNAPQLSGAEHIASWYTGITRYFMNNPDAASLPPAMEQEIIAYIDSVEGATRGEARQNVVNTSYQVLEEMKRNDLARTLLLAELEKSRAPYYFMSSLGDLEEEEGNNEAAVDWHRRAWEGSNGEATRFQWGYQYVDSLARLAPDQGSLIVATSERLLGEFTEPENVLTGRNFDRLMRLFDTLDEWQGSTAVSAGDKSALHDIYSGVEQLCTTTDPDSESAQHCLKLQQAGFSFLL